jgi:voltage-gated potassium channel
MVRGPFRQPRNGARRARRVGLLVFILTAGSAVVANGGATVAQLGPGDFFGEGSLLGGGRRGATITVTSPSEVLVMFGTEFRRLQQSQPQIAAAIEEADKQRHDAG